MKEKVIIGIDPDVHKSGFAVVRDDKVLALSCLRFFDLIVHITAAVESFNNNDTPYIVIIEQGEKNKTLFTAKKAAKHASVRNKEAVMCNSAMKSGKNFAISDLIIQHCEREGIKYRTYAPKVSKVAAFLLAKKAFKDIPKVTNSETRDALRCCLLG